MCDEPRREARDSLLMLETRIYVQHCRHDLSTLSRSLTLKILQRNRETSNFNGFSRQQNVVEIKLRVHRLGKLKEIIDITSTGGLRKRLIEILVKFHPISRGWNRGLKFKS
jgi:hypothetical protein